MSIKCNKCNIDYNTNCCYPAESEHTTYIICPKCKKRIYGVSDYGFGPVWPAHMYYGNDLVLRVTFSSKKEYEIKYEFNNNKKISIPQKYLNNNYKYHFEILDYIYKKNKRLIVKIYKNNSLAK